MKVRHALFASLAAAILMPAAALSHCQVPCGIYDDIARLNLMLEDTKTIGKAVMMIGTLAGVEDAKGLNQLNRWVANKEKHASSIITVMAEYFLTQRVKPVEPGAEGYDDYLEKLAAHHAVIVAAMKTKQDAEATSVRTLDEAIEAIRKYYED